MAFSNFPLYGSGADPTGHVVCDIVAGALVGAIVVVAGVAEEIH